MHLRKLTPRRQLVVRLLIPVRRDVLLVLLDVGVEFGSSGQVLVDVGDVLVVVVVVGGFEVLGVVGSAGMGMSAAHLLLFAGGVRWCWKREGGWMVGS